MIQIVVSFRSFNIAAKRMYKHSYGCYFRLRQTYPF